MTVLVDMDDCLLNLLPHWMSELNRQHNINVHEDDIKEWDIQKAFPHLTKKQIYAPIIDSQFWESIQPTYDGAIFISKLVGFGYKVKIVTASFYETIPTKIARFLELYPQLKWSDITITADKQSVKGDVLVDDYEQNLLGGNYRKILLTKPHNRSFDAESNGIVRVKNLREAYNHISRIGGIG